MTRLQSRPPQRRLLPAGAVLALVLAITLFAIPRGAQAATEYEIKAVYLLNFAKSIAWPSTSFSSSKAPLVIGVLGSDPFGATLTNVCRGETAGGRPIVVTRLRRGASLGGCHLIFVSKSEASRAKSVIGSAVGSAVFLVGDFSGFATLGGHLNFILKSGSVRYEFNAPAATRNGLKIPSKIQRSGSAVTGP